MHLEGALHLGWEAISLMEFIMELGCLLGLSLAALIAIALFVGLRRLGNTKEKISVEIVALVFLILSIVTGWAVLQPGWF
jgi:hypothetical protein